MTRDQLTNNVAKALSITNTEASTTVLQFQMLLNKESLLMEE